MPSSLNSDPAVNDAASLNFNAGGDLIMIPVIASAAQKDSGGVVTYKVGADSRSPLAASQPLNTMLLDATLSKISAPVAVVSKDNEIVALDKSGLLRAFRLGGKAPTLLWEIKATDPQFSALKDFAHLVLDRSSKSLFVFDSFGNYARVAY